MKKTLLIGLMAGGLALAVSPFYAEAQETDTSTGKAIKTLIQEARREQDPRAKAKLLNSIQARKADTNDDLNAIVEALDDEDRQLQEAAVVNIYRFKEKQATNALLRKIQNLPETRGTEITRQQAKEYKLQSLSALALSEMKVKEALPTIMDKLANAPSPAAYDEKMLASSAINYGKDSLQIIQKKIIDLEKINPEGKNRLLSIVMNTQDTEAASELKSMFESNDPGLKTAAARGLRNIGHPVEISSLLNALKDMEDKPKRGKDSLEARGRLVDEIGFSANPSAIPVFKNIIGKEMKKNVQQPSCYSEMVALARIGTPESHSYLQKLYRESQSYDVKRMVIVALGKGGSRDSISFLLELLDDAGLDPQLRLYCAEGLAQITGEKDKYAKMKWEIMEGRR